MRGCGMNCSRDEAMLMLGKWRHNRANLLPGFQASASSEVLRVRGRISWLNADEFKFVSRSFSFPILFEYAIFDYEEDASDVLGHGQKQGRAACSLRLQLPAR